MTEFSDDENALLDETAERVVRMGMAVPALVFLETVVPMNMVTSSMLHVASPLWRVIVPASRIDQAARLLARRGAIPELIRRIDRAEHSRRSKRGRGPDSPAATAEAGDLSAAAEAQPTSHTRSTP